MYTDYMVVGGIFLKPSCLLDNSQVNWREKWKTEEGGEDEAQMVECLPNQQEVGVATHACGLSTWEVGTGGLEVQGHPLLCLPRLRPSWVKGSTSKGRREGKNIDLSRFLLSFGCGHSQWCSNYTSTFFFFFCGTDDKCHCWNKYLTLLPLTHTK